MSGNGDLVGAGISPKERLERIETVLERIDRKLDGKVDRADFITLEARVREIEQHGSAAAQSLASRLERIHELGRIHRESLSREVAHTNARIAYAAGAASIVIPIITFALQSRIG